MSTIDPRTVVKNHETVLDDGGEWPNFHDAEIVELHLSRGDVRPDDDVYVFPEITVKLELCALGNPYSVTLRFNDCCSIEMPGFNHQNPIMDLRFGIEERGYLGNGEPMTPYILVNFDPCFEFGLSFKCFSASVLGVESPTRNGA